jgi:hypothetical protein
MPNIQQRRRRPQNLLSLGLVCHSPRVSWKVDCPAPTTRHHKARAAIRRPKIPAVEAPIWMLLAAPVEDEEAADADEDAVELPDARAEPDDPGKSQHEAKQYKYVQSRVTYQSCCRRRCFQWRFRWHFQQHFWWHFRWQFRWHFQRHFQWRRQNC